jgi:peptidoglycan hydrolase CwlO-like protein
MKKLFLILFFATSTLAQDIPQLRPWSQTDAAAEIGRLYIQVQQLTEYIHTLQAKIQELQAENAKLKGEVK